jgi:tetratricopeptide (TPR) repeat protein
MKTQVKKKHNFCFFFLIFFLISCDLTSNLYKEILEAQELVKSQSFEKAVIKYESILKKNPSNTLKIKINFQLGDIYSIYLNKQDKAIVNYNKVLELADDPLWQMKVLEKLADIHFSYTKDYKQARNYYEILQKFEPKLENYDYYQFQVGLIYFELEDYKKAEQQFLMISQDKNHKYYTHAYYYIGLNYFYEKKWAKSIDALIEYIKREKEKSKIIEAKFLLANAYETSEELKKAYNIYYSILGEYPNPQVIKNRLKSLFERRVARKR